MKEVQLASDLNLRVLTVPILDFLEVGPIALFFKHIFLYYSEC